MGSPSSRVFRLILCSAAIVLVVAFVAILVFFGRKEPRHAAENRLFYPQRIASETAKIDTDNDGLKDWEEVLYGTDAKNQDTDGDATKDGEEILAGRDPAKSGIKNSEGEWSDAVKPSYVSAGNEFKENITQTLSESIIPLYLAQKRTGKSFDPDAIAEELIARVENSLLAEESKEPELKIVDEGGTTAVKSYLNRVAEISQKNLLNWEQDPLALFASITRMEELSKPQLSRFDPYILKTDAALEEFIKLPVPRPWAREHQTLVKNIRVLNLGLKAMRQSDRDMFLAIGRLRPYLDAVESLGNLISSVKERLSREGIAFSKNEPMTKLLALTP